jgi:hypothetical protein
VGNLVANGELAIAPFFIAIIWSSLTKNKQQKGEFWHNSNQNSPTTSL